MYYFLLLFTSLLYAGNFVSGKILVSYTSPFTVTGLRLLLAVPLLVPLVWWKDRSLLPPLKSIPYLFVMGITGVSLFNIFTYLALESTSADNVGLLSAINPIAIAIASYFFLKERVSLLQVMGMLISLTGVIVVISNGQWSKLAHFHFNVGDLWMLAAVATWGLFAVAGRKAMAYVSPYKSTLWATVIGAFTILPFNLAGFHITHLNATFWGYMLYTVIGGTVIATILWNLGVKEVGATRAGIFLNFNPIFTAILAFLLLGVGVTKPQIIGTLLVIAGVTWFTLVGRKKNLARSGSHT
jgi:drug/metabolite transporter (DMT)-like permease